MVIVLETHENPWEPIREALATSHVNSRLYFRFSVRPKRLLAVWSECLRYLRFTRV